MISASQGLTLHNVKKQNKKQNVYMYWLRQSNVESEILRHCLKTVG